MKTLKCTGCRLTKKVKDFYVERSCVRGFSYNCKECSKKRHRTARSLAYARNRKYKWAKKNKNKIIAHKKVARALRLGVLTKKRCFICGDKSKEAHHIDYNYPLQVLWLCIRHHKMAHES